MALRQEMIHKINVAAADKSVRPTGNSMGR